MCLSVNFNPEEIHDGDLTAFLFPSMDKKKQSIDVCDT